MAACTKGQQDLLAPDQESLYREVMQESYKTILSMAPPLPLQAGFPIPKAELLARLERGPEAWAPDPPSSNKDADEGMVKLAKKKWPETVNWWNSYRSPVSVSSSESSSSDDESTSEKDEEENVHQGAPSIAKPRAALLGQSEIKESDACGNQCSPLQGHLGNIRPQNYHTNKNKGSRKVWQDSGESQKRCPDCGKTFARKSYLNRHLKTHSNEKPYQCSICGKSFREKFNLKIHLGRHMRKARSGKEPYECPECGENFVTSASFTKHRRAAHTNDTSYQCPDCERSYVEERYLVRHLMTAHSGTNLYKCSDCGKGFREERDLIGHQKTNHVGETFHPFPNCGRSCREELSLVQPPNLHTREVPFKCLQCGKSFRDNRSLAHHWRKHEKEDSHKHLIRPMHLGKPPSHGPHQRSDLGENLQTCPDCGKCFKDKRCFANHLRTHTREQPDKQPGEGDDIQEETSFTKWSNCTSPLRNSSLQPLQPEKEGNRYICLHCGKIFKDSRCFANHQKVHIREEPSKPASHQEISEERKLPAVKQEIQQEGRCYKCSSCEKVYATQYNLNRHQLRVHTEGVTYKCSDCGESFAYKWYLAKHQRAHTEGQRCLYKCSLCEKAFVTKRALHNHQCMPATDELHKCSDCGKGFAYKLALDKHQKIHAEERLNPHKCSYCGKTFRARNSFYRHEQLHVKGKSHKCNICEKAFAYRYSLTHHQEIHQERKFHKCSFCGKTFRTTYSLYRHKRIHMETRSYQCTTCRKAFGTKYSLYRHQGLHSKANSGKGIGSGQTVWDRSTLGEKQASGMDENSDNSDLSGHEEESLPECSQNVDASALFKPPSTHLEEDSPKGSDGDPPFQHNSVLPKVLPSCTDENLNKRTNDSIYGGQQGVHKEDSPPVCSENGGKLMASFTNHTVHLEEDSISGSEGPTPLQNTGYQGITMGKTRHGCSDCGKAFRDKYSLTRHQRTHITERPYRCPKCDKSFRDNKTLLKHQIVHSDLRPYQCRECGKSFKSTSGLTKHRKTHSGEKPYCCPYCGKRLTTNTILRGHLRIHTGEKPYKCAECDKDYRSKQALKRHLVVHLNMSSAEATDQPNKIL